MENGTSINVRDLKSIRVKCPYCGAGVEMAVSTVAQNGHDRGTCRCCDSQLFDQRDQTNALQSLCVAIMQLTMHPGPVVELVVQNSA